MMRVASVAVVIPLLVFLSRLASAQSAPDLHVQAEVDTVGVGDMVHVTLSATSADAMPADAQPGATPGFVVRGQNASPSQTHISINGSRMDRYTLTTTWVLQAKRVGTFHIGPPSVIVGSVRYGAHTIDITVVPAGHAPRRSPPQGMQSPFGLSPFDMWKGLFPGLDTGSAPVSPAPVTIDPKLSLEAPRAPFYFLHATLDKTTAVIGQQVTFSVYEYIDTASGRVSVNEDDVHDANAADFVKHALQREDGEAPLVGYASIGGRTWAVNLVRRWALFPLHAGDLPIGPMRVTLLHVPSGADTQRAAEALHVHVTDPPLQGRPPGYALGDVGRFSLSAQLSPREVDEGGAVGVHVEVSGTGNLPGAIATPARDGVEWLAPEVHEQLGTKDGDAFGGKRTFDFVVRLRRAGRMDLGELTLPFWDPDRRKYEVARAALGEVRVAAPMARPSASGEAPEEILPGLPAPRDKLEGSKAQGSYLDDSPIFWIAGIGGWPLALGVAVSGRALGRRLRDAWRRTRRSPTKELQLRLAAAATACDGKDARMADAAIAHALEAAAVAHAGVSVRGAVGGEVVDRLECAGVSRDAAARVAELLRECESARFAPHAADIQAARDRWLRASRAIRGLERGS